MTKEYLVTSVQEMEKFFCLFVYASQFSSSIDQLGLLWN